MLVFVDDINPSLAFHEKQNKTKHIIFGNLQVLLSAVVFWSFPVMQGNVK